MDALRRIWDEIRRGENLGTYLAIAAAFAIAALKALDVASDRLVDGATLALLGVVCASFLATRHQNAEVKRRLAEIDDDRPLAQRFLTSSCEIADVTERLKASSEMWMWGTTLSTHIPGLMDDIKTRLTKGLRLRVLMIEPESAALKMAAFRGAAPACPRT